MIAEVDIIIDACLQKETEHTELLANINPENKVGAKNLLHYLAYRSLNTKQLYSFLVKNGLGAFKSIEDDVLGNLRLIKQLLFIFLGEKKTVLKKDQLLPTVQVDVYEDKVNRLFGGKAKGRATRIMVTQPGIAARRPTLIRSMMDSGMNCIRVNCAHDGQKEWLGIITHAKEIASKKKKNIAVSMDLAGPKIRTGNIAPGPKVLHLTPKKDVHGISKKGVVLGLLPTASPYPNKDHDYIHVPPEMLQKLRHGDVIECRDNAGKQIKTFVLESQEGITWVKCHSSAYLRPGLSMTILKDSSTYLLGDIPRIAQHLLLHTGDLLTITDEIINGEPARYDENGIVISTAKIPCTYPDILQDVRPGESIFLNDGKITGIIRENTLKELQIEIIHAKEGGSKLKSDKGINFPESKLNLSGLTQKDRDDLKFVVQHADVVNMSFVNTAEDVQELLHALKDAGAFDKINIVLKIETMQGLNNLAAILLTGMQTQTMGIMIARGDLAIECGWERIGIVQQELLKICRAAHTPVVWATQVLEQLAKKGVPSRAEITDAIMGHKADCIMLNKGDHIVEAIGLLNRILVNLHHVKKDDRISKIL